jgi:type IV pilus assembly protein PilB
MVNVPKLIRKKLGEILVEEGLLKDDQVQEALRKQKETGGLLGEVLVRLQYVSEIDIARAIAKQFGLPYIDASKYHIGKDVMGIIPSEMLHENQFVPLDKLGKALLLAVSGVLNGEIFEQLEKITGSKLFIYVSTVSSVQETLKKFAPSKAAAAKG